MTKSGLKLVVGLGNPGEPLCRDTAQHRLHGGRTAGGDARHHPEKQGHQGIYGVGRVRDGKPTLLLPQTFMNLSGASVGSACKSLGVVPGDLIVVHDDIDLPFGTLRIKTAGGTEGITACARIREVLGTR